MLKQVVCLPSATAGLDADSSEEDVEGGKLAGSVSEEEQSKISTNSSTYMREMRSWLIVLGITCVSDQELAEQPVSTNLGSLSIIAALTSSWHA